MPPVHLTGTWRDLPEAGRRAVSARKIALHARGVTIAYALLVVLFYAAGMASGIPFSGMWDVYGVSLVRIFLTPPPSRHAFAAIVSGAIVGAMLISFYGTAVSKLTFEQLRGDYFYPMASALRFAGRYGWTAVRTVAVLVIIVAALRAAPFLTGLLGRIPAVGPWLIAVQAAFMVPLYFVGLGLSLGAVCATVGWFVLPSICGIVRCDVVEASYQLVSLVWNRPLRLAAYVLTVIGTQAVAGAVFYGASAWGYNSLMESAAAAYVPLQDILSTAADIVWGGTVPFGPGFRLDAERVPGLSVAETITTVLAVLAFLFVTIVWLSYVLSVGSVGNTLAYIALRRRIRGDNVLEIAPEVCSEMLDEPSAVENGVTGAAEEDATDPPTAPAEPGRPQAPGTDG